MKNLIFYLATVRALKANGTMRFGIIHLAEETLEAAAKEFRARVFRLAFRELKNWK